ncbi:flagellar basal body rod protein FlgB [Candidatus Propionivibrio aalborgensis]|uniref:flagellar basal body rod protein FlgB n=1 Tax=Candidatus Propionivibrio aalborgensis TaxID=1860101 RepID=UPI001FDEBB67|nr:flagellar basal body rod protein FlgB [Candidatus Propionivibrio aalborgensis]
MSFSEALGQAVAQANGHGAHDGSAPSSAGGAHDGGHAGGALSASSSEPHPQHFSMGGAAHRGPTHFQEKALGLRVYRQQLLASNIANADTPGYKAVDIDFAEAAQMAMTNQGKPLALATSASGHIAASAQGQTPPYPLKYHIPYQASADGNTVEMDLERKKMVENSLMHQFSLDRVSGHFKMLMELYQSLK